MLFALLCFALCARRAPLRRACLVLLRRGRVFAVSLSLADVVSRLPPHSSAVFFKPKALLRTTMAFRQVLTRLPRVNAKQVMRFSGDINDPAHQKQVELWKKISYGMVGTALALGTYVMGVILTSSHGYVRPLLRLLCRGCSARVVASLPRRTAKFALCTRLALMCVASGVPHLCWLASSLPCPSMSTHHNMFARAASVEIDVS